MRNNSLDLLSQSPKKERCAICVQIKKPIPADYLVWRPNYDLLDLSPTLNQAENILNFM